MAPSVTRVPWSTVVAVAVVVSYANGFWTVALRGAVGAIERAQEPVGPWVRESTLLLPVYLLAVLAALTLAMRWFGSGSRRVRDTTGTVLLVVAAVTVVGVGVLVANAAYDYHLQAAHVAAVDAIHGGCPGCLADRLDAARALQVRAVGLGGLLVLASTLVLVGLVVALRGGRLGLSLRPYAEPRPLGRSDDLRVLLAAGLLGAAVIHAAVAPAHLAEWHAAGVFFVLASVAGAVVALLVVVRYRAGVAVAAVVVSAGPFVLWLISRTAGLPVGPEAGVSEHLGIADGAASVLEAVTLVAALVLLRLGVPRGHGRPQPLALSHHLTRLAVVGLLAVGAIGLGGTLGVFTAGGHESGQAVGGTHE